MLSYKVTEDEFRAMDGGHCYLWAKRDADGLISLLRFPNRASPQDLLRLGKWALDEE